MSLQIVSVLIILMVSLFNFSKRAASSIINGTIENSLIVNSEAAQRTLIWMHGLGDTPHGFADIFSQIAPSSIRVVLLQAPTMPVTINGGMQMPSWYDIKDFTRQNEDSDGILTSGNQINKCIDMEINRMKHNIENGKHNQHKAIEFASSNVFVGGFSQGGAMAVYCGFKYPETLGGVTALSSYVLSTANFPDGIHKANKDTSLFVCHGEDDQVVPLTHSEYTFNQLNGYINMKYEKYKYLQHEINPEEIQKVCEFVSNGGSLNDLSKSEL
eukprot:527609_1